ncbi:MAG: FAD-dependent oxidoreductase, partial [Acidobacteria bacterium]|nr:FAD-dependent oxidoreductase [Acidobacteriota bacterium]
MNPDVLVVGGGPTGLATAIALRLEAFRVTLVERRLPPVDKACGE